MDTSETGLEKIIVDWLRDHNGYEQETPHAYNKDLPWLTSGWNVSLLRLSQKGEAINVLCLTK